MRVEAAAYRGHPVYFEILPARREADQADRRPEGILIALLAGAIVLAVRNLRQGRGDVRGAVRLGLTILAVTSGAWLLGGHHTASRETSQLAAVLGVGGWPALLYGLSYLAMEPAVRRRWPWRITAWNRLLDGRLHDPMVGRDLLIGLALGAAVLLVLRAGWLTAAWAGVPPPPLTGGGPFRPRTPRAADAALRPARLPARPDHQPRPVPGVVLRTFPGAAAGVAGLGRGLAVGRGAVHGAAPRPESDRQCIDGLLVRAAQFGLQVFALARFGLIAFAGLEICTGLLSLVPLTTDLSAWYASQGVLMALIIVGLAVYAFFAATRGHQLFGERFFGDE